jgi:hypothetical protein
VRPTRGRISDLTETAQARLDRLQDLSAGLRQPFTPGDRRLLSYVTIEAASLWAQYSTCLFLSAALGARDASGKRVVRSPTHDTKQAIDLAVYAVHPRLRGITRPWKPYELPDFQNKGHLMMALAYIGATIYAEVDAAVSYKTRVLADLPTMRNFYAHKAELAARKAAALGPHYGLTRPMSPHDLLCTPPLEGGGLLLNEWLADLAAILSLMP